MLETFAALAEPNRLRIVELLRDGPRAVLDIGASLRLAQPQVSKHLRVLKAARLVEVEPRAQQRLYGLRPEPMREMNAWLEHYRRIWDERLDQLDAVVSEMVQSKSHRKNPKPKKVKR
jgi:DNA-binding transcriptional ArsR family regulator